jgi:hypothetical protein
LQVNYGKIVVVKWLLFVGAAAAVLAADLDDIRATQQKLNNARDSSKLPRDEVPLDLLPAVKKQLLAWAESRLQNVGRDVSPEELTRVLGEELNAVVPHRSHDTDSDLLGDLDIEFSRPEGEPTWLAMSTLVGIPCGFDRSSYLYEWRDDRWNRRFSLEANDYRRDQYGPEESVELRVSPPNANNTRLVLVTGFPPACISVWHTLYIRLFRVDTLQTKLLEETPTANLGEEPAYSVRLEPSGVLVEFSGFSVDTDILVRTHILHYKLAGNEVRRIEPIALSAQDFVDEWLTSFWTDISEWSDPKLSEWHKKLHGYKGIREYAAVRRCGQTNQWQVALDLDERTSYFSVIDTGEFRFRMVDISESPRMDCSGHNEMIGLGAARPTLFPKN